MLNWLFDTNQFKWILAPSFSPHDPKPMQIYQATLNDLTDLSQLFEAYRQFYHKTPDPQGAENFIKQRLQLHDSVIFICRVNDQAAGFVQLYPTFSSTNLQKMYILNDLFVTPAHRRAKIAQSLMSHASQHGRNTQAYCLKLCTAIDNEKAANLYRQMGYKLVDGFDHYTLVL